jgi:hypothetical protein
MVVMDTIYFVDFEFSSIYKQENMSEASKVPAPYTIEDLYRIIQVQQSTINKLTSELTKKSQTIPRENHEKILNELEAFELICHL